MSSPDEFLSTTLITTVQILHVIMLQTMLLMHTIKLIIYNFKTNNYQLCTILFVALNDSMKNAQENRILAAPQNRGLTYVSVGRTYCIVNF